MFINRKSNLFKCFIFCVLILALHISSNFSIAAPAAIQSQNRLKLIWYLNLLVKRKMIPGLVMLVQVNHQRFWIRAYSLANIPQKVPMKINDMFRIASITKMYVAALILFLEQKGLININNKLSSYLGPKTLHGIANAYSVTIKELLDMSSGIYNYTKNAAYSNYLTKHPQHKWTANELLNYARHKPALFSPGTNFDYSNTNYLLLQLLIEKITNESLAHNIHKYLLTPLHLNHTYLELKEPRIGTLARGYLHNLKKHKFIDESDINDAWGFGDGGLVANAFDVNHFLRALFEDTQWLSLRLRQQMEMLIKADWGYSGLGFEAFKTPYGMAYGHRGGLDDFQSFAFYIPSIKTSIVFLANTGDPEIKTKFLTNLALKAFVNKYMVRE